MDRLTSCGPPVMLGADWVILQPPRVLNVPEVELIRFFGAVADRCDLPVGIQNAPEYIGIGISNAGFKILNRNHPNVTIAKMEAAPTQIREPARRDRAARWMCSTAAGGVAMIEALRAGAVGNIPGGECFDIIVKIYERSAGEGPNAFGTKQSACTPMCCPSRSSSCPRSTVLSPMVSRCSAIALAWTRCERAYLARRQRSSE